MKESTNKDNKNNNVTIEHFKSENKKLKEQINTLNKEIVRLNKDNKKQNDYIKQINNLKKEIDRLNQENKKQNDYIKQINDLKNQLKEKDNEINELNNKISNINIKKYVDYNDIMVVHFNSGDGKIDHGIKCLPEEKFVEVEEKLYKIYDEKLYKIYDEYRKRNNIFLAKGNLIKRDKTMSENNIKDGDKIQLQNLNACD